MTSARPSTWMLPVVLLAVFVIPMGVSGTAIALPQIANDLGNSPTLLQWVVNGFNVAFAIFGLVWGVASDRIGYRNTFRIGIVLVLVSVVLGATAPNLLVLDLSRFVSGVGSAAVVTGAAAILSNAYSHEERSKAFAIFGTIIGLGLALGPTFSGALIALIGWRGVFWTHGFLLVIALAGSVTLPHIRHAQEEGRKLVDFGLLRNPHFLALCLVPVTGAIGFVTLLTYLPVALSGIASLSSGVSGVFMLPMTIPVLIGPILAARLIQKSARVSSMSIIYVALSCLLLGTVGMLLLAPGIALGWVILPMTLVGFGFGLPLGLIDSEALATVPANRTGTAAGVLNLIRIGSEALFVGLYASALSWLIGRSISDRSLARSTAAGHVGQSHVYASAFHWVILTLVALLVLVITAITTLHRARVVAARVESAAAMVNA